MERAMILALALISATEAVGAFATGNTMCLILAVVTALAVKLWCDININKKKLRELWQKKNTTRH